MEGFIKRHFNLNDVLWPLVDSHRLKSKCIVLTRSLPIRENPLWNPVIWSCFISKRWGKIVAKEMAIENRQIHST